VGIHPGGEMPRRAVEGAGVLELDSSGVSIDIGTSFPERFSTVPSDPIEWNQLDDISIPIYDNMG
jgi:hypothetical protein